MENSIGKYWPSTRQHRRLDGGRRRSSKGDGIRNHRGIARTSVVVHVPGADGHLCHAMLGTSRPLITTLVEEHQPEVVVLDLSGVPDLEYTTLKMLTEAERRQRDRGVAVWLAGLNPEVLRVAQRSALGDALGRERMHSNLDLALAKYCSSFAPITQGLDESIAGARQE